MLDRVGVAAKQYLIVRERLRAEDPDIDEQTLADTVEGLTDIHEIVAAVVRSALIDEALVRGLKGRIEDMQSRSMRLEERAIRRRHIARDVMVETDIRKIGAPDFTVSVRPGSPILDVVDESAVPGDYFEPREPRLNRQALLAELKLGTQIAGARLSVPEPVLSVRTK
jgi:hypothetical protein